MAHLIKLLSALLIVTPPQGYATIFYTLLGQLVVKKAKLADGTLIVLGLKVQLSK